MPNVLALKQRSAELKREVSEKLKAVDTGTITVADFTTFMEKAGIEDKEISLGIKSYNAGREMLGQHGSEDGGTDTPDGGDDQQLVYSAGAAQAAKIKAVKENWTKYKSLQTMARENYLHIKSGGNGVHQGSFSFYISLKNAREPGIHIPTDEELGLKAQGVANLQGVQTSGTTVPPTGMLAAGAYFQAGTAGPVVEPYFEPGIAEMRFYPNVIETLFPSMPTSSPVVSFVKQTAMTNNAAAVPEGATKPTSTIAVKRFSDEVGKIANLERVTDETIQDAPQFWSLVQQDGIMGVGRKSEIELLAGVGLPGINGILNRHAVSSALSYPSGFNTPTTVAAVTNLVIGGAVGSGAAPTTVASVVPGRTFVAAGASAGVTMAEALLTAMTDIRLTWFFEPDAILLNPLDWQTIRLSKDANGQYLGGSFFGTNYGVPQNAGMPSGTEENLTLWSKRVVSTPAQPQSLSVVGDFGDAGKVLRLGGLRVDVTNLNGFDFEQNLWTMRAEVRMGLQMKRPELLELVQFTAS